MLIFESCLVKSHTIFRRAYFQNIWVSLLMKCWLTIRGEKILDELSKPRFVPSFEISRSFLPAKQVGKGREISKPGKNRGL